MNWYKQQSIIQKEATFGQGLAMGMLAGMIGFAAFLNMSKQEVESVIEQHGGDQQAAMQELAQEVERRGGNPVQIIEQTQQPDSNSQIVPEDGPDFVDLYMDRMSEREGFRNKVYDDGVGVWTVGIGHAMDNGKGGHVRRSQRAFQSVFGNSVNWNDVRNGRVSLTDEQVRELAAFDIDDKANVARNMFNDFDTFPPYLQEALLDSVYRGDTGPKTTALINQGRWREAAREYLNRRDYIDAKNNRPDPRTGILMRGIIPRMEHNRDAMLRYAEELGQ